MNKKGFTLIELLVTLVIMMIILLMVVPAVNSLQNNNKDRPYEVYADAMVEAAKLYVIKEGEDLTGLGTRNWTGCIDVTYQELLSSKLIKAYGEEGVDCSNSSVRYTKESGNDSYKYNMVCTKNNEEVYNEAQYSGVCVQSTDEVLEEEIPFVTYLLGHKTNKPTLTEYQSASTDQKNKMFVYTQIAGTQQAGWTTDELTDYRFAGQNPNNYITFNNELWRIIGVFTTENKDGVREKRVKLIRNTILSPYLRWDSTRDESSYGKNNWSDSQLQKLLNPGYESETYGGSLYWNRVSGTCYGSTSQNSGGTGTTTCNFTSQGLTDEAKVMIDEVKWYLGGTASYTSSSSGLAKNFYYYERSATVYNSSTYPRDTNWLGRVGLLTPSDYGFATGGGTSYKQQTCLNNYYLGAWNSYSNCYSNDWIYNGYYQWTMTPYTSYQYRVFYLANTYITYNYTYTALSVRPVIYLKPNLYIKGGSGTQTDPFQIG